MGGEESKDFLSDIYGISHAKSTGVYQKNARCLINALKTFVRMQSKYEIIRHNSRRGKSRHKSFNFDLMVTKIESKWSEVFTS